MADERVGLRPPQQDAEGGLQVRDRGLLAGPLGEPDSIREVVTKNLYYGRNIAVYVSKHGVLKVSPLRATYVEHIPSFGLLFFPFLLYKMVQYLSAFIGMASR